jgi:hypothetical protein
MRIDIDAQELRIKALSGDLIIQDEDGNLYKVVKYEPPQAELGE